MIDVEYYHNKLRKREARKASSSTHIAKDSSFAHCPRGVNDAGSHPRGDSYFQRIQ